MSKLYYLALCTFLSSILYVVFQNPFLQRVSYLNSKDTWNIVLYHFGNNEYAVTVDPYNWFAIANGGYAYIYYLFVTNPCDDDSEPVYKLNLNSGHIIKTCIISKRKVWEKINATRIHDIVSIPILALPQKYFDRPFDIISILNYLYHDERMIK